jgi:hypothetical protein
MGGAETTKGSDMSKFKSTRRTRVAQPAKLPPDPEGMNDSRAEWAGKAITAFQRETTTDDEDVLGDLIADLMHWADRNNYDFEAALFRAQGHYRAETGGEVV